MEPLGDRASLEEIHHWGSVLRLHSLVPTSQSPWVSGVEMYSDRQHPAHHHTIPTTAMSSVTWRHSVPKNYKNTISLKVTFAWCD